MIEGLHHISIAVKDLTAAANDYAIVLGRQPDWLGRNGDTAIASFHLANLNLMLVSPADPARPGDVGEKLARDGEGILAAGFAVPDAAKAYRLMTQRGVAAVEPQIVADATRVVALPREATHGVQLVLVESAARGDASGRTALDHSVVSTPDAERAMVLYGARLGLDMRMDRSNPDWDARLLFFRCGDLIVEIASKLSAGRGAGPDRFMGLTWRAADIRAVHARLDKAGFKLSEVRKGRKPGTAVFTVRDRTGNVPTIFVGPDVA